MLPRLFLFQTLILFAAIVGNGQTFFPSPFPDTEIPLKLLTSEDLERYRLGLPKPTDRNQDHILDRQGKSKCDLDVKLNIERSWTWGRNQAIFLISVNAAELSYVKTPEGPATARFSVFVKVRDATTKTDGGFEALVRDQARERDAENGFDRDIVYRQVVSLAPGSHRMDVTIRDINRQCRDLTTRAFTIQDLAYASASSFVTFSKNSRPQTRPFLSTLILGRIADSYLVTPAFYRTPEGTLMMPSVTNVFEQGENIAAWHYQSRLMDGECMMNLCGEFAEEVDYTVVDSSGKILLTFMRKGENRHTGDETGVMSSFSSASLPPGKYKITATVKQGASQTDEFTIVKPNTQALKSGDEN